MHAETRQVEHAGLVFDVQVGGPADGDPVLLLHGFPQDATSWDGVVPALWAAGLRTIVPDQRGYSPGARPEGTGAYRMGKLVGDALAFLDDLDAGPAHVVGHDWGGGVAWALAARVPERVTSLTAVSTPHPVALGQAMRTSIQALKSWYVLLFRSLIAERVVGPRLADRLARTGLPPDRVAHYAARMAEPGALTGALNWYRAMPFTARSAGGDGDDATTIHVPTTYVWGRHDVALGSKAADLTADHVAAAYRFAPLDGGHWLPETHPDIVAGLVLDRVRGATPGSAG